VLPGKFSRIAAASRKVQKRSQYISDKFNKQASKLLSNSADKLVISWLIQLTKAVHSRKTHQTKRYGTLLAHPLGEPVQ